MTAPGPSLTQRAISSFIPVIHCHGVAYATLNSRSRRSFLYYSLNTRGSCFEREREISKSKLEVPDPSAQHGTSFLIMNLTLFFKKGITKAHFAEKRASQWQSVCYEPPLTYFRRLPLVLLMEI